MQARKFIGAATLGVAVLLTACSDDDDDKSPAPALTDAEKTAVLEQYANVAGATYTESLTTAQALQAAVDAFLAVPSAETLDAAKAAYRLARVPYQQSEALRFDAGFVTDGLASVDDQEGAVNAWPLDEGFIDYVDADSYGSEADTTNFIATAKDCAGADVDGISGEVLEGLQECGGSEANVATGFHAVEFMLWGQDLNGEGQENLPGQRPFTDFVVGDGCTNGNCERRREYLDAAADLLVDNISALKDQWTKDSVNGVSTLKADLTDVRDVDNGIHRVLYGMGSLALGELASERMWVALSANSQEDEHDCFSDLTHVALKYNAQAIENVFNGSYGSVTGPSISSLVEKINPELNTKMEDKLAEVLDAMNKMEALADQDGGEKFDQQIMPGGNSTHIKAAIVALADFNDLLEQAADEVFGIDNLDSDPGTCFADDGDCNAI